ncbi:hypothetical protein [Paenibacillus sp. LK1]|uniref:hypothetical protein n=1 Tax=Paenibacillus sp. LK1 TaxID=2053014 RepID=UPI000C181DBC|nr:hypothetical protein [Paenibacillus sp. LK1]PIH59034.1 hypothetical protein CS562_13900 [Paenibacillus sp. LK1]
MSFYKQVKYHEKEAKRYRELAEIENESKKQISIGVYIFDREAGKVARVSGLEKGSIDFSADNLDGSYSRGYHYVVNNWRLATVNEIDKAIDNPLHTMN